MNINMQAPAPGNAAMADGTIYTPDAYGFVSAQPKHISALLGSGFMIAYPGPVNFRNLVDGGDFSINPWQRNIPGLAAAGTLSADIANTVTYFADRWFAVGGASSAIKLSNIADATLPGTSNHLKFQRKNANADVTAINLGHVIETADCFRAAGNTVTLSFWAKAGANFSAAGGNIGVKLFAGTGTNDTAANMVAGSWAGSATPIAATQAVTAGWTRYSFTGVVPQAATQLGVMISFTPVGTAGADDSVQFDLIQLEIGSNASPVERRDVQVELEICQRYCWALAEPASGVVVGMGTCPTTTTATIYMATPVQMVKAPTLSVTTGSFNFRPANAAASGTAAAGATHTPNAITIAGSALTATTAGFGTPLLGGGGAGFIVASADF